MHRNGLIVRSQDHGRYHYSQAVKEFRQLLETPRQVSLDDVETCAIFNSTCRAYAHFWKRIRNYSESKM
ncbi:hypothetical protein ACN42_g7461 [Penicillium freii]|uniref:Uncharacterized protein n=1 Tax=Penicillium freii TaxID=48697 RepID=A0A101MG04_PENFR|nr:hypothetical protein ACN42_g7461 [Penicillium freii]